MCTLKYRLNVKFKTKIIGTPMLTFFLQTLAKSFLKQVLFHIKYFSSALKKQKQIKAYIID